MCDFLLLLDQNPVNIGVLRLCSLHSRFYLAFELATGGELFERIRKGRYPEAQAAGCIRYVVPDPPSRHSPLLVTATNKYTS